MMNLLEGGVVHEPTTIVVVGRSGGGELFVHRRRRFLPGDVPLKWLVQQRDKLGSRGAVWMYISMVVDGEIITDDEVMAAARAKWENG